MQFTSSGSRIRRWLGVLAAALLPVLLHAQAQATTGVIRGLVTDETSKPVAAAQVTLRNLETNVTRTLRTSDRGIYVAPLLPLGRYEVSVRAIGFAAVIRRDLVLRVGQALDIPFTVSRQAVELAGVKVSDRQTGAVTPRDPMQPPRFPRTSSSRCRTTVATSWH